MATDIGCQNGELYIWALESDIIPMIETLWSLIGYTGFDTSYYIMQYVFHINDSYECRTKIIANMVTLAYGENTKSEQYKRHKTEIIVYNLDGQKQFASLPLNSL